MDEQNITTHTENDITPDAPSPHVVGPVESEKPKKEAGKKLLLTLLIIVLIALVGGGIWWWQQQTINNLSAKLTKLEKENQQLQEVEEESTAQAEKEKIADWTVYESEAGQFSLKHNPDWSHLVCDGNEATVYIAPDSESQAICFTEHLSPIVVASTTGDNRSLTADSVSEYGNDVVITKVKVDGVSGTKATYTHRGDEFAVAGAKHVHYEFFTGGRTYSASYVRLPADSTNLLEDFELMVNNSLRFSAE